MIEALAAVISGGTLGLSSIPHCIGMCGGIAGACSRTRGASLTYQLARLGSYASLGALSGLALGPLRAALPNGTWAYVFAAVTAGALVFSALRVLRSRPVNRALVPVSALRRERPRDRLVPFALGVVTGLLPCGALYGALAVAGAAGDPAIGAASMAAFGLTSSVGLAMAQPVTRFLAKDGMRHGRKLVAAALLVGAAVVLLRPLLRPGTEASCHATLPQEAPPALAMEAR